VKELSVLKKVVGIDSVSDTLSLIMGCLSGDAASLCKAAEDIVSVPYHASQNIFWRKFCKFIEGVYSSSEFARRFAETITNTPHRDRYSTKIMQIINQIDEDEKVDYIVNATRALCWGRISTSEYFRICLAIQRCFFEDLMFVRDNYSDSLFAEDMVVSELKSCGLMYQPGSDGGDFSFDDSSIKNHRFTPLAELVYKFSLAYDIDEE